jgi:two-component system response regulator HydG
MSANEHVLIVDDDLDMARCLADVLATSRFRVSTRSSAAEALTACQEQEFGVVVSDLNLGGTNGIELMSQIKSVRPQLPVILVTGDTSVPSAVEAIRRGAYEYIMKPCDGPQLRSIVGEASASRTRALAAATASVAPSASRRIVLGRNDELIGRSGSMQLLQARIDLVSPSSSPVLVQGETGTGKELVARAIHARSPRRKQPFVTVNTSAIPDALLESEMFGHVRGAFTGATQAHRGFFAQADGGTLFLDEIGEMPLGLQAKLLRVLQAGEIHPVGSGRVEYVDVRVVTATHRRLSELVQARQFREDLFYRLNVITIAIPPLRSRAGDISELASFFLARARERAPSSKALTMRDDLKELLERRAWPGNVRELENAIERLVVLAPDSELTPEHLALLDDECPAAPRAVKPSTVDALVREHVLATLALTGGNKPQAAKMLGIDLSTLYRWQQKWRSSSSVAFDA